MHSEAQKPNIIVTKIFQKLTEILEVMTFNVGKNQENHSFFMFFKIEMTFILKSMGLHGNKIFHIEGNFISFKWEKKLFIFIEYTEKKILLIFFLLSQQKIYGLKDK